MKLVSCKNCGIVLDQDKLKFATDMYDENDEIDMKIADWNSDNRAYEFYVKCPACGEQVFKE